tara:strand:+ start:471 stop:1802 length:1332 start_codon:yes stop_codon:yes gene_type:complete
MASNKKITELAELSEADLSDDDVLAIVDVSADTTNKVRKSTLASALAGVASLSATSPVTVSSGTGAVNVAVTTIPITSGGTGATTAADARTNLGVPASTTVVTGPASATDSALALFDGTTGKIIKDSTYTITAAGAALIDDASASAQRTTLGAAASGANTDITSLGGLTTDIAVADGGTGAGTASAARTNLGAAASGSNSDITALTGLTTDIAVADGGTGAGTASAARTNLGAAASGSNSDITALTGLTTDLSVAQGGTGAGTFTANGVLHGNGTSAIGVTATGTSGQVLTSNGSGSAPTFQAAASGGKVIQVVTATTDTAVSSSSSTRADTGLTASITPANTANKILVIISQHCSAGAGRAVGDIILMRGATDLINYSQQANADNAMGNFFFQYLDSPSATTSTTYKTQQARVDQSGVFVTSRDDASGDAYSYITLIELDYS